MMSDPEKTALLGEFDLYEPGPPPDYYAAVSMDEYGPPSYKEPVIQGLDIGDQSSAEQRGLARLAYLDFYPYLFKPGDKETSRKPIFDSFKGLMRYANQWLELNRQYMVLHIESIEMRIGMDGQLVGQGNTIEHTAAFGNNGLLRGIRLWLVPSTNPSAPPQMLAFFNFLPEADPIEKEVWVSHGRRTRFMTKKIIVYPNFKNLDHTLEKLNKGLANEPMPGKIKAVQTMELLYQEAWGPKCIDPNQSCYFAYGHKAKLYLQYLRIFYILGETTHQHIEIKDFVPEVAFKSQSTLYAKPRFEEFKDVFQRASTWVYQNDAKAVNVLNIQTVDMKVDNRQMMDCAAGETIVDSKRTWYQEGYETVFLRSLRVASLRITEASAGRAPLALTQRLFLPVRTAMKTAESIPQCLSRVNAWLHLTGVSVYGVTTEKFLYEPEGARCVKPDESSYMVKSGHGIYMVTALRLFLVGVYIEPWHGELETLMTNKGPSSSTCAVS